MHQNYDEIGEPPQLTYESPHLATPQPPQPQFTRPSTTYSTPIISSIDQSMPHDILDEALNDAENYESSINANSDGNTSFGKFFCYTTII